MIVNGKEYEIDDLIKSIDFQSNMLNKVNSFYLSNREIEILERNSIEYRTASSLNDLICQIQAILEDEFLDSDDADELDWVLEQLSERNYYSCTQK